MNTEETEIYEFLKARENKFVAVTDISKAIGRGRQFQQDRQWARPVLRRMEIDGIVESNPYGEYRVKGVDIPQTNTNTKSSDTEQTGFKEALRMPGASLGDTTIIRIDDV